MNEPIIASQKRSAKVTLVLRLGGIRGSNRISSSIHSPTSSTYNCHLTPHINRPGKERKKSKKINMSQFLRFTPTAARRLATPSTFGSKSSLSETLALLPPLQLYRRILRVHRKKLDPEMRILGDGYVKSEFRAHRNVDNPLHIVHPIPSYSDAC